MELRNISKSYHGRPVLQNVSFTIEPGVTALWAPSGAGKTTLLRDLVRQLSQGEGVPPQQYRRERRQPGR